MIMHKYFVGDARWHTDFLKQFLTVDIYIWFSREAAERLYNRPLSQGSASGCGSLGNVMKLMGCFFFPTVARKDFHSKWHFVRCQPLAFHIQPNQCQILKRMLQVQYKLTCFEYLWGNVDYHRMKYTLFYIYIHTELICLSFRISSYRHIHT